MTSSDIELARVSPPGSLRHSVRAAFTTRPGYLVSPLVDFLCLGGASLIVLPLMAWLLPAESTRPELAVIVAMLAHIVNHPHFAHSYQIFYRRFGAKAFGPDYSRSLQMRYRFAGIVVPLALILFFAITIAQGAVQVLGYAVNAMGMTVGWHYVKQGYGMLMVDAVLKRRFFADREKKFFLVNAFACWIFAWMMLNRSVAESDFWGLKFYSLAVPDPLFYAAGGAFALTSVAILVVLARKWRATAGKLPLIGLMAYAMSLYAWVVLVHFNPLFVLVVPAFHSLQYLLVVWRFQWNVQAEQHRTKAAHAPGRKRWTGFSFIGFIFAGVVLGFAGFWFLPSALQVTMPYNHGTFGPALFMFVFWLFINLHHYFIDNVIWRRENPDTKKYLFGQP